LYLRVGADIILGTLSMAEPKRAESSPEFDSSEREARVEALLVDGLDLYFAGRYDEAIHLWTRVLFLDRAHARARAYIDRARTALAEQHRRSDEMLHASAELMAGGHTDQARDLLARATAASGDDARAAALRWRLEHLERARAGASSGRSVPAAPSRLAADRRVDWRRLIWIGAAVVVVVMAVALRPAVRAALGLAPADPPLPVSIEPVTRPVLSSTDVALVRARTLYARGRLAEALRALDGVDRQSTSRATADQLRVEIQQLLLRTGRASAHDAQRSAGSPP
jgi:tetratricopeptide (TPR) repeat protein